MSEIVLKKTRNFGEILTDPFIIIFRNLKAIFTFNMLYIFLPMAFGFGGYSYYISSMQNLSFAPLWVIIVSVIFLVIAGLHVSASSYAVVKSAEEDGIENIKFDKIHHYFKKSYVRNLIYFIVLAVLGGITFALIIIFGTAAPVLLAIMMFIIFFAFLLYFGPLLYLSFVIYLYNQDQDIVGSITESRKLTMDHWGTIFGTFIVAGFIVGMLNNSFSIPFMLIGFIVSDLSEMAVNGVPSLTFLLVQYTIIAFFSSFLVQYTFLAFYLRYFDLREKETGENVLAQIAEIGENKSSFFENEGEF